MRSAKATGANPEVVRQLNTVLDRGQALERLQKDSGPIGALVGKVGQPGGVPKLSDYVSDTKAGKALGFSHGASVKDLGKLVQLARSLAPTAEEREASTRLLQAATSLTRLLSEVKVGRATRSQKLLLLRELKALSESDVAQAKGGAIPLVTPQTRTAIKNLLADAKKQLKTFHSDFDKLITGRMSVIDFFPETDAERPGFSGELGGRKVPEIMSDWAGECSEYRRRYSYQNGSETYARGSDALRAVAQALRAGNLDEVAQAIAGVPENGLTHDRASRLLSWLAVAVDVMRWEPVH